MGYYLQAFIGKHEDLQIILKEYPLSRVQELGHDLCIIPMTEELFDQINDFSSSEAIFQYLNINIEEQILKKIGNNPVAYIEAEYFGGKGGQSGIIWKDGKRHLFYEYSQDVINKILRFFNVTADTGKDEFDTLAFGRHRNTRDWV